MRETLPGDLRRRTEAKITERVGFGLALVVVIAIHFALEWLGGNEVRASSPSRLTPSGDEPATGGASVPGGATTRHR